MSAITWPRVAVTALVVASTYVLRWGLALVGLQALTFVIPVLFAGYVYGSVMATIASGLTLAVVHAILWVENPAALFTRRYAAGIFNLLFLSTLVILYAYRHERVLRRLDESLLREKTERTKAEEASRVKDQFLATLSHELRTPINVILGYLQILRRRPGDDPGRALDIIQRNAEQQAQLIEDVLDVSRITSGVFQLDAHDLHPVPLLLDAIESLRPAIEAKGLHLETVSADDHAMIAADPHRLRQVFWNILSNAVKFTPAGGHIAVRTAVVRGQMEIQVQDTGRGIAREFLPHVFELFRQADPSTTRDAAGIGLGLNLVKRFVELQGGEVSVHSPGTGLGTTVTCRFPVRRALPQAHTANRALAT